MDYLFRFKLAIAIIRNFAVMKRDLKLY